MLVREEGKGRGWNRVCRTFISCVSLSRHSGDTGCEARSSNLIPSNSCFFLRSSGGRDRLTDYQRRRMERDREDRGKERRRSRSRSGGRGGRSPPVVRLSI